MAKEIFISYSRKDFDKVKAIKDEIDRELGIDCWMDLDGIESGDQFKKVIIKAINEHDTFLFMLSTNSMASPYALKELGFAASKHKRVILVFIESCQMIDEFLFDYQDYDNIDWNNTLQHDKLMGNLHKWFPGCLQREGSIQGVVAEKNTQEYSHEESIDKRQNEGDIIESYEKGIKLYYSQQYKEALETLRFAAENGHSDAQYFSGLINFLAYCGIKNHKAAKYWFEKSAEQGHKFGEYYLAYMYEHGYGVDRDIEKALYWYKKSAEQQNPDAYFSIGCIYEKGDGFEQNDKLAFENYLKAASIGSSGYSSTPEAMLKVAQMYEYGFGIEQSSFHALKWYKKYLIFIEKDNAPGNDREKEKILDKIKTLENKN